MRGEVKRAGAALATGLGLGLLLAGPGCAPLEKCPTVWCVSACSAGATGSLVCADECLAPSVPGTSCEDGGPCCALEGVERCPALPDAGAARRPGQGALRGCPGCSPARPQCDASSEYLVSVACHPMLLPDAGLSYAVGGIAGAWCYPLPPACAAAPSCDCLRSHGAFVADGGLGLACPGAYWFCIDGTGGAAPELHCNPP